MSLFPKDKKQTLFQIQCQVFQPVPLKMDDKLQQWTRVAAESNKLGENKKANVICSQERDSERLGIKNEATM